MTELLRQLRDALNDGDDDALPDILERLFEGIDDTETGSEWVLSRGGAGPTPLGEAEGRPPQTDEAAA